MFFYLPQQVIKDSCNFKYYYNNTYIKPVVFDRGDEIISANYLNKESIECIINNKYAH